MDKLWADAKRPDNNLGDWQIGEAPHKMTMGSAVRLLDAMDCARDKVPWFTFYDIGCGHGLVSMAARYHKQALYAGGIEIRKYMIEWAEKETANRPELSDLMFTCADAMTMRYLSDTWSHVLAFDKDYPPAVRAHINMLAIRQKHWVVWACTRKWTQQQAALARAHLVDTKQVRLCHSNESHKIYIYKRC